jgi:lysophospholipase L1-like esterase
MRILAVAAAAAAALLLAGCAASPAPPTQGAPVTDPADRTQPLVAFYGDSYTLGTGASDLAVRWSTVICEQRGWTEFNPSVNGLGFVNNRPLYGDGDLPSLVIQQQPDIVFVTMGLNDNFSYARVGDQIREQIDADLDRLVDALPDARFIVVEPFWYTDERPESVEIIIDWVHESADRIGADWIPGASHWIEGHPEWMASDGLHPNDDGYAEIAIRMDEELKKLDL